jgi:putative Mn2+ efflux pump MntP
MTSIHATTAAAAVPISALLGSKIGGMIAQTATEMPAWASSLISPAGGFVFAVIAIRWLIARLDKSEAKHEKREQERDKNFQTLVTLTVQTQEVIEQNSSILRDVKTKLEK